MFKLGEGLSPMNKPLGGGPKQSASEEDSAALQNWVIQTIATQMRFGKNPTIASRRDSGLDRRAMRRACRLKLCLYRAPRSDPVRVDRSCRKLILQGRTQVNNRAIAPNGSEAFPGTVVSHS